MPFGFSGFRNQESGFRSFSLASWGFPSLALFVVVVEGLILAKKQSNFVRMKNVNVTVDETTWRAARIYAVEHDTSVSALVRQSLDRLVVGGGTEGDEDKGRQERESLVNLFESVPFELGERPGREELHGR